MSFHECRYVELVALVQRMRALQRQRDELPGCSREYRRLTAAAEAAVDTHIILVTAPDPDGSGAGEGLA